MASPTPIRLLQRAWYAASFDVFTAQSDDEIVGQGALNQVWQYALDTKNFHETSHGVRDPVALAPQQVPKLLDRRVK